MQYKGTTVPIKGFLETSFVDWPGKICSVIFLPDCNFRCRYCHNAPLVLEPESLKNVDFQDILTYLAENKGWVDGVCISGGEPTLHDSLPTILAEIRNLGFTTKLDTNGTKPAVLKSLITAGLVDYIAMDVKAPLDEQSYCAITQSATMLDEIKESIRLIISSDIQHEFRCTVIPSYHQPHEIVRLAKELNGAQRFRLQNFNPHHTLDPDLCAHQPYDERVIHELQQQVDALLCGQTGHSTFMFGTA